MNLPRNRSRKTHRRKNNWMGHKLIYFGIGSNIENREDHICEAIDSLRSFCSGIKCSSLYETLPLYIENQPKFLNCVTSGLTNLQPSELLGSIQDIEKRLGRDRQKAGWKGPRTIDIDILLFGSLVIREKSLTVPHPLMHERRFVLVPLLELDPTIIDPAGGKPYSQYLSNIDSQGIYYYPPKQYSRFSPE